MVGVGRGEVDVTVAVVVTVSVCEQVVGDNLTWWSSTCTPLVVAGRNLLGV